MALVVIFQGGIRVNAFVSGGFLAPSVRGTRYSGLVALWDWYGTLCALAGVDPYDARAAAAGLPAVDSHDLSRVLVGTNLTSPRTELPLGTDPRASDLAGAPPCASFADVPQYDEELRVMHGARPREEAHR